MMPLATPAARRAYNGLSESRANRGSLLSAFGRGLVTMAMLACAAYAQAQDISYTQFTAGPSQPVLTGGGPGAWDEFVREKVQIIQEGSTYRMWYVGHSSAGQATSKVGYATSTDGLTWTKFAGNPVVNRSSSDQDILVLRHPDGTLWMYIEVNNAYIDLLTSVDGINWSASTANPVKTVAASPVVWREAGSWYLLYEHMAGPTMDIWLATSSDGINWTDSPANPVISDTLFTAPDSILKDGATYHLYYHTANNGMWHATSQNLTSWSNRQLLLADQSLTSPYVFRTSAGELWAYLWADDGSQRYYFRRGAPLQYPIAWKLDEGLGTIAEEELFQVAGTLHGGATWTAGVIDGGVQFDGDNDYISTPFATHLPNWSVAVWVRSPASPASGPSSGPVQREANFQIVWNHADSAYRGAAAVRVSGNWHPASFGSLAPNTWYHLAATYDGETLRAYRDGILITANASPSGAADPEPNPLLLGRHATRDRYFAGTIDDVRIYDRALSSAEVAAIMSQGVDATPPGAPGELLTSVTGQSVGLWWSPAQDAESGISQYKIYRGVASGGSKILLGTVSGSLLTASDEGGAANTTYYYEVRAVNGTGVEGPPSNEAAAMTGDVPPATPTGVTATIAGNSIVLDWQDNIEEDLAGYRVFRSATSGGPYAPVGPALVGASTYTDAGLAEGSGYFYVVRAVDAGGFESGQSAETGATIPSASSPQWQWRLDDGAGTQASDSGGGGVHGVLQGGAVWSTGVVGGGVVLDGVDDYIATPLTQNIAAWTVAVWVRSPAAPANGASGGPIQREANYQIVWNHGESTYRGAAALRVSGQWHAASFGPLSANTWYRLVATYDGETLRAYRDGALISSNTSPSGPPDVESLPLMLGKNARRDQFFAGTIDDVRIYDRALSAAEVAALMTN